MIRQTEYIESEVLYEVLEVLYREVDELMHQLAPEGWNNSPYHFPFELIEGEREALYKTYDTVACAYERKFGPLLRQYITKSRYEIDYMTRVGGGQSAVAEFIYLVEHVMLRLSEKGLLFNTGNPGLYHIIDGSELYSESECLCMDLMLPNAVDAFLFTLTAAKKDILLYIPLSDIYAQVFAAFRRAGYDWRYFDEGLLNMYRITTLEELNPGTASALSGGSAHDVLNTLLADTQKGMPPDVVVGYFEAYDRWPVGYPPTIEDLRDIADLDI